jgi:hypothetical protein
MLGGVSDLKGSKKVLNVMLGIWRETAFVVLWIHLVSQGKQSEVWEVISAKFQIVR